MRSVEGFLAEDEASCHQEDRGVSGPVEDRRQPGQPGNRRPVMNDEGSDIKKFEMRNDEVDSVQEGRSGFRKTDGDFVQMLAQQQYCRRYDKLDSGIGRCGGEHQRAQQGHGDHHGEQYPMQADGLQVTQQRPGMLSAGADQPEKQIEAKQGQAACQPAADEFSHD